MKTETFCDILAFTLFLAGLGILRLLSLDTACNVLGAIVSLFVACTVAGRVRVRLEDRERDTE